MPLIEVNWHPDTKQLRLFGLSALAASAVLACVLVFVWAVAVIWAFVAVGVGTALLLCSLIWPRAARVLYLVLTIAVLPIGFAVSFVLLAAFYFLLLTPVGLFFRLLGRDPLGRRFDRSCESYWTPRRPPASVDRYFHQF